MRCLSQVDVGHRYIRGDDHDDNVGADAGVDDTKIRSIHTSAHSHGVVRGGDRKSN